MRLPRLGSVVDRRSRLRNWVLTVMSHEQSQCLEGELQEQRRRYQEDRVSSRVFAERLSDDLDGQSVGTGFKTFADKDHEGRFGLVEPFVDLLQNLSATESTLQRSSGYDQSEWGAPEVLRRYRPDQDFATLHELRIRKIRTDGLELFSKRMLLHRRTRKPDVPYERV